MPWRDIGAYIRALVGAGNERICEDWRGRALRCRRLAERISHFLPRRGIVGGSDLIGRRLGVDRGRRLRRPALMLHLFLDLLVQTFEIGRPIAANLDVDTRVCLIRRLI